MKKFLSVLLTIAMVMSLFTGTVLAVPGPDAPDTAFEIAAGTASYDYNLKTFAQPGDSVSYVITEAFGSFSSDPITVPATGLITINTSNLSIAPDKVVETYTMVITNTAARDHDDDAFAVTAGAYTLATAGAYTGAYAGTATAGLYQSTDGVYSTLPQKTLTVEITVVLDTTVPVTVITLDPLYNVTTLPSTITFQVTAAAEVWVDNAKALLRPDGAVFFTVSNLSDGENTLTVRAYDMYGNVTIDTLTINYLAPSIVVMTIGSLDATRDGVPMTGMDQAPVIVNGRTFLPVRFVFQNLLGGTCNWDPTTQTITSVVKGKTIKMTIGSKIATVGGQPITLLAAPFIEPATDRTLVPMREIMEAIGCQLDWNALTQTVTLIIPQ